jgi:hypothetical protein
MRALRLPRLLILALALLLVGGQQAALAHMLGHAMDEVGKASRVIVQQGDDDHGSALTLSHVCTTCLALDFFAAPPPAPLRPAFAEGAATVPPAPTFSAHCLTPPRRYAARAPPAPL